MIAKESVIEAYMINDKKVIAEMLYDTVTMYEELLKVLKTRTCESCKSYGEYTYEIPGAEDFLTTKVGCTKMRIVVSKDFGCDEWEETI